jgi:hypothetical protein
MPSEQIDLDGFRELAEPMPTPIYGWMTVPDWVTITDPPSYAKSADKAFDLSEILSRSTENIPADMIHQLISRLPNTIDLQSCALSVRDITDTTVRHTNWPTVFKQLRQEDDSITTEQVRRAAQRLQSATVDAPEHWTDSYNDLGIDKKHHGLSLSELDTEFDTIEAVLRVSTQCSDQTYQTDPVSPSGVIYDAFHTNRRLIQGDMGWSGFLESRMVVEGTVIEDLREDSYWV